MTPEEKGKPIEGAALIAAKCPSCGAILSVRKGAEVRCEFCGNEFMLRESYGGKSREIRDYYELAYAAQQAGDAYGADRHFAKVLELDGNEALAWYGKGVVALGDSNAREIDAAEAITFFKKALANVDAEEKDGLGRAIRESCFRYADAAFDYLWSSGFPDEDNFRRVLELFNFADEVSPLDNDRLKRVVEVLCTYSSYLVKYSARISLWLFSVIGICARGAVPGRGRALHGKNPTYGTGVFKPLGNETRDAAGFGYSVFDCNIVLRRSFFDYVRRPLCGRGLRRRLKDRGSGRCAEVWVVRYRG
jgi:tetratricopeptide (TPR) repeat protein